MKYMVGEQEMIARAGRRSGSADLWHSKVDPSENLTGVRCPSHMIYTQETRYGIFN